jgi:hypothetical protein
MRSKLKGKAKKTAPKAARRSVRRPARKSAPKTRSTRKAARKPAKTAKPVARRQAKRTAPRRRAAAKSSRPKPPGLQRERRRLTEEPVSASVPSSLDFDRSASSAKSGREAMLHHRREHTEAGPSMTGGDVDADWEDGYSEGDEAPGGDNPTPDQDVVEEIGRALGVEYEDGEELKGADKITERDTNRWEYDPASAEDYNDRNKKQ